MKALTCEEITAGTVPTSCTKVVSVASTAPVLREDGFAARLFAEE
jgi:hypothetical protein